MFGVSRIDVLTKLVFDQFTFLKSIEMLNVGWLGWRNVLNLWTVPYTRFFSIWNCCWSVMNLLRQF